MVRHRTIRPPPRIPGIFPTATASRRKRATANPCRSRTGYPTPANQHWFVNDLDNPYVEEQPFDWLRGYHVGGRSLMWARQSYRFGPLDFEANGRKASAFRGPSATTKSRRGTTRSEIFAGISGSTKGLQQLPDGKFLPPHRPQLRRSRFQEAPRREAGPQAHHRPLRQSHRAAHAQRKPAARHLPGTQHVHPRLPVWRLFQQRFGDAAVGRAHRQHDAAGRPDRLRAHLRRRQGQGDRRARARCRDRQADRLLRQDRVPVRLGTRLGLHHVELHLDAGFRMASATTRANSATTSWITTSRAARAPASTAISTSPTPAAGPTASTSRAIATSARTGATICAASATRAARRAPGYGRFNDSAIDRRGAQEGMRGAGRVEHGHDGLRRNPAVPREPREARSRQEGQARAAAAGRQCRRARQRAQDGRRHAATTRPRCSRPRASRTSR